MTKKTIEVLERALAREKKAKQQAEKILEQSASELYALNEKLQHTNKRLEALVEQKSSELKGIFENIADAYAMINLKGRVLKMNDIALGLLDFRNKDEIKTLLDLVVPEEKERTIQAFKDLYHKGILTHFVVRIKTQKGVKKLVHINASIIYDQLQHPIAVQGIARDITAMKLLEQQKEELLQKLAKQNEQLQEYAHVVSHDLKSPLRSINALIAWIKEDSLDVLEDQSVANFELIEATLQKMEQLITDILEYSQIDAAHSRKQQVDLNAVVAAVLQVIAVPKHITIEVPNNLPQLWGDPTRFHQLFQNLIDNAVKFIEKTEGHIELQYSSRKKYHLFALSDNGIGIAAKFHKKIFNPFEMLNKKGGSSGIGLSIVKKIIALYEGKIWLRSQLQKGTTVYFSLKK